MPNPQIEENDELDIDEGLEPASPSFKSVNSLSLGDAQELVAALSAIALKFGNNQKGVIATLNTLLKRSEVLDKEQQDIIAPLLGELKALLTVSQDELKNFNEKAQSELQQRIEIAVKKVDLSPLNLKLLETINKLQIVAQETDERVKNIQTLSFLQTTKWLLAGGLISASFMFGFYQHQTSNFEEKLTDEYNKKWDGLESRFKYLKTQKQNEWNVIQMDDNGKKYLQFLVRDNNQQVQCGWVDSKKSGMGFAVSYFNIPIFK